MATLIIKSNPLQAAVVEIQDLGFSIDPLGASESFDAVEEIQSARESVDLRVLLTDGAYDAGATSTLILNDGANDIAQADALNYLDQLIEPDANGNYRFVKLDDVGEVSQNLAFDGVATVSSLVLGNDADAGNFKIVNLGAPTNAGDATNKQYVDSLVAGVLWKQPVRALADADVPSLSGTTTIDGVALVAGDRVLLTSQTTGSQNGIWEVQAGAWTRPTDYATGDGAASAAMFVQEGTSYADQQWFCTTDPPNDIIDTDATAWTQIGSSVSLVAGDGLTLTGNVLDVVGGLGITANANDIEVDYGLVADIQPLGPAELAGVANLAARADHVHTHGDRGGDAAGSQHDADQIDVEGAYAQIGAPTDAESAFSAINDALRAGQYVGKWLNFAHRGRTGRVQNSTNGRQFLNVPDGVFSNDAPVRMMRGGRITGLSLRVSDVDASRAFVLTVYVNGVASAATLALPTSTIGAHTVALNVAYSAGDELSVAIEGTSGTGRSTFNRMNAVVECVDVP